MPTEHYPGIARAALEIALDNGGIYRGRPVKQMKNWQASPDEWPGDWIITKRKEAP